jgi:DNA-binding response OmpR family regulator
MVSVLIVEDEANMLELVSVYLTAAGFKVIPAGDGVSAARRSMWRGLMSW